MSIETLLTLGLTATILGIAFLLKLIVLGSLRLGLLLAGRDSSWLKPQEAPAARRRQPAPGSGAALGRTVTAAGRRAAAALAALGAALAAAASSVGTAAVAGAAALEEWADATNRRLAPRTAEVSAAFKSRTAAAARKTGPLLVTAIATVQHLVLTAGAWVHKRLTANNAQPERPAEPERVIDLDHDDPLTAGPKRPTAGARL